MCVGGSAGLSQAPAPVCARQQWSILSRSQPALLCNSEHHRFLAGGYMAGSERQICFELGSNVRSPARTASSPSNWPAATFRSRPIRRPAVVRPVVSRTHGGPSRLCGTRDRFVARLNIGRFKKLLGSETSAEQRVQLERLITLETARRCRKIVDGRARQGRYLTEERQ